MEGLIEELLLVAPVDEDGVERPVEVVAALDADGLDRLDRGEDLARADGKAGAAQRAREMHQIGDELAAGGVLL